MNVNVFTRAEGADNDQLLAVPTQRDDAAPPKFDKRWQYFATVDTSDAMVRSVKVEEQISAQG
ncbi:MAG: hypothetical protein JWQ65_139 [Devosia sp.]|nr:hypothetical protein [Devosia sp.]